MVTRQRRRLCALLIGLFLLALPAGAIGAHSHPDGTSKNCTLCQVLHLPVSLTAVPGLSRPIARPDPVFFSPSACVADGFMVSPGSRGPPTQST